MYLSKEIQYLLLSLHFLSIAFSAQFFVSLIGLVSVVGLIDLDGLEFCKILVVKGRIPIKKANEFKCLKNAIDYTTT